MLKKNKIIIIDGYNVLRNCKCYAELVGHSPHFRDWTADVLNAAREALFNDVAQIVDKNTEAIIVYDAAKRVDDDNIFSTQKIKNIQVLFTRFGESADERIQKLVYNARQRYMEVRVVTSDLGIQDTTMNTGVVRMSAREFEITTEEINEIKTTETRSKIEDIVDADTANKLLNLRNNL